MESTINAAPQIFIDREKMLRGHRHYWVLRRAQDMVFSLLALILLAPLALVISLAIVLDSPGDGAIFRQRRVGRDGKLFWLYKFRTMCPDAEQKLKELMERNEKDGPVFKMKNDPRITRVGKFLRKTSLDEIPQFWNVLKGEMSVIGPRPIEPDELVAYDDSVVEFLSMTSGITGWWQTVSRNDAKYESGERQSLELFYVRNRSLKIDVKVFFETFRAMFGKHASGK